MYTHFPQVILDCDLDASQREEFFAFEQKCFGRDLGRNRKRLYFSEPLAHIILQENDKLTSYIRVFIREVVWDGQRVKVGGIGSVATDPDFRGQGRATLLLQRAMSVLEEYEADFALLQTNIAQGGPLYGRVGFFPARKSYTFLDIDGQEHAADARDVMVAPIKNSNLLRRVLKSTSTFHIGSGDW